MTFCATLIGSAAVEAASEEAAAAAGDIEAGRRKAAEHCVTCHGPNGISEAPDVPHLAGQHAGYMMTTLQGYSDGTRASDFMVAMIVAVGTLNDEEIANVAAYYANLTSFTQVAAQAAKSGAPPEEDPFAAVKAMTEACAGCHGEDGNSDQQRDASVRLHVRVPFRFVQCQAPRRRPAQT